MRKVLFAVMLASGLVISAPAQATTPQVAPGDSRQPASKARLPAKAIVAIRALGVAKRMTGAPRVHATTEVSDDELHKNYFVRRAEGPDGDPRLEHHLGGGSVLTAGDRHNVVGMRLYGVDGHAPVLLPLQMIRFARALGLRHPHAPSAEHVTEEDRAFARKHALGEKDDQFAVASGALVKEGAPKHGPERKRLEAGKAAQRRIEEAQEVEALRHRRMTTTLFEGAVVEHDPIEDMHSPVNVRAVRVTLNGVEHDIPRAVFQRIFGANLGRVVRVQSLAEARSQGVHLGDVADVPGDATVYRMENTTSPSPRASYLVAITEPETRKVTVVHRHDVRLDEDARHTRTP